VLGVAALDALFPSAGHGLRLWEAVLQASIRGASSHAGRLISPRPSLPRA
jgi:hypothetical protein